MACDIITAVDLEANKPHYIVVPYKPDDLFLYMRVGEGTPKMINRCANMLDVAQEIGKRLGFSVELAQNPGDWLTQTYLQKE